LICTTHIDSYSSINCQSQAFLSKGFGDVPWYVYVAGGGVALLIGSLATKFAADAMKKIESSPEPSAGPNMVSIRNKVNPKEIE
jgi:hypothetical protein